MAAADDDIRDVVLHAESAVCSSLFTTREAGEGRVTAASAGEAVASAAREAAAGKRAAAVIAPAELASAAAEIAAAARARAPIVVHVAAAANGARPGRDELASVLDAGAGLLVAWSAQEAVDLALAARRAAEDSETPFVIVSDGAGPVMSLPGSGLLARFLGEARTATTRAEGDDLARKKRERSYAARVPFALAAALRELGELTGRSIGAVERFETADADEVLVALGQAFVPARAVAEAMRRQGRRVGAVGVRALRPCFTADLVKALGRARSVAVIEPLDLALAPAGPLATMLKAAFADALTWAPGFPGVGRIPTIVSVAFATLDGAVTEAEIHEALRELGAGDRAKRQVIFGSEA